MTTTTDTFGLPDVVPHLIAKLRLLPPELLALITQTTTTSEPIGDTK